MSIRKALESLETDLRLAWLWRRDLKGGELPGTDIQADNTRQLWRDLVLETLDELVRMVNDEETGKVRGVLRCAYHQVSITDKYGREWAECPKCWPGRVRIRMKTMGEPNPAP